MVAVVGVIDLYNHKDPNITQYTIFDKRTDGEEINFAESYGGFAFSFGDHTDNYFALNATFGSVQLNYHEVSYDIETGEA